MNFRAVDLETNGVDVEACEVAQVAIVSARTFEVQPPMSKPATVDAGAGPDAPIDPQPVCVPDMSGLKTSKTLCCVTAMPAGATKVHGLTFEQLKDEPPFVAKVRGLLGALTKTGAVVVTFNGAGFDLPVIARYAARHGKLQAFVEGVTDPRALRLSPRERFEELLSLRHVDVARVWQVARARKIEPPWGRRHLAPAITLKQIGSARGDALDALGKQLHRKRFIPGHGSTYEEDDAGYRASLCSTLLAYQESEETAREYLPELEADDFTGSLKSAHKFWIGYGFDGAHEAGADCVATLAVLRAMLTSGFVDVETATRWTREPLPGDVDFDGVFKWDGDQAVCKLKKFANVPIEDVERGFLSWMLEPERNFHRHTKHIVSEWLAGRYPIREYEKEETT